MMFILSDPPNGDLLVAGRSQARKMIGASALETIVFYEVDEKAKAVRILFIRHRREAYR